MDKELEKEKEFKRLMKEIYKSLGKIDYILRELECGKNEG
jgi:hypothetical protein